jgi:starch synthase
VHNLAFQGRFPGVVFPGLGLPPAAWGIEGVEYYGGVGYLKAGLAYADRVTTVSPTYAAEIRSPEGGMGLDGVLRAVGGRLVGILNGIDTAVWDPARDQRLPARFDVRRLAGRAVCKAALQGRLGLAADAGAPLFGVVSRLTWQKGLDLLLAALPTLLAAGGQLAVLGAGEPALSDGFAAAATAWPGRIGCHIGYDEGLAHLIQAGSDAFIVPSRFEPCGLTQLCALRYGALPVVARVGGLADTVVDANDMALAAGAGTGVMFAPPAREMLESALSRTAALWRDPPTWRRLQRNAMATDVSWRRPASRYAALFRDLLASGR